MSYLESEALCPYYKKDLYGVLFCEIGNLKMRDSKMLREIGYKICAEKYEECPFKVALDHFYERSGSDAPPEECVDQCGFW